GQGDYDVLLWKCDTSGNFIWGKTYGGVFEDASYSVLEHADGSIVVSGYTNSMGYGHGLSSVGTEHDLSLQRSHPLPPVVMGDDSTNIFLMKTDATGDTIWT